MIEFLLAIAIIMSFIAIVVVASVYVTKNKIYSSNEEVVKPKEETKNFNYVTQKALDIVNKYRYCKDTVTTTEIKEATIAKYPKFKDMDFQYVFNKILYYSRKTDIDMKYNKVGKTFFYTIWNVIDMEEVLLMTKNNSNYNAGLYSHKNLLIIVRLAKDIINKKFENSQNTKPKIYRSPK